MKKSKIFVFSGLIALAMIFSVLFGFNTNNIKSVYASSTPEIVSVELGLDDKVPTVGEKIFYPEVISVNGDPALKDLVRFPTENSTYQFWEKGAIKITDSNYTFEEGVKYTYYVQLAKTAGGLLDKDVVVTFAGMQARENEEDSIAFFFDVGYLGTEYDINLSEGITAYSYVTDEEITKAHKNELVYLCIDDEDKALRSLTVLPKTLEIDTSDYSFRMPAQEVTITVELGTPVEEITFSTQNFEIGSNVAEVNIVAPQNANYSVEYLDIYNIETGPVSGTLSAGTYMLSILLKLDDGYGAYYPTATLDGWIYEYFNMMDELSMEDMSSILGTDDHRGYFMSVFLMPLSDTICPVDGNIKMDNYEFGKTVQDITFTTLIDGVKSNFTPDWWAIYDENEDMLANDDSFVLSDKYYLSMDLCISSFDFSNCSADYFTINGIKPDFANRYFYDELILCLSYELPAVEYPKFDIIFNANGGSGTMEDAKALGGYELPACTFTAPTGKQFKGWALTANGEVIASLVYNVTTDIELFAIWEDVVPEATGITATYTGTILAGTTINPSGIQITIEYSNAPSSPVNAGAVEYWYHGTQITNPTAYVFGVELIGNLNITVKYQGFETTMAVQIVGHTITFDANNGTGTMASVEYVGAYTLPANEFIAPTGKQFKGWSTSATGEIINSATYDLTGDITLYAIWEDVPATNYLIRFNANGASGNMSNVQANGEYTLPTCTFTAPIGKVFKGWALTSDGEVIEGTTTIITADTTLHAIWEDVVAEQPEQTQDTNNGLGAGAIVGIILALLVVVGTGGFAIFWFAMKKKSFADLGKVFKSLWAKIKKPFKKKEK